LAVWKPISDVKYTSAITPPAVTNDSSQGYTIGSLWLDTSTNVLYHNTSPTVGAAVWYGNTSGATVAATFPLTPYTGQMFYSSVTDLTYIWDGNSWIDIVSAGSGSSKTNYSGTVAPTVTDDSSAGYSVGSIWIDTAKNATYINVGSAVGAASWKQFGNGPQWKVITAAYNAVISDGLLVNTSGVPVSVTLPAVASVGSVISFVDHTNTFYLNNLTILRNGNTIAGSATDLIVSTSGASFRLLYNGADWRVIQ